VLETMMNAVLLVLSWTLFVPPAHDVDVHAMPDMETCLERARAITERIAGLEEDGLKARLVARCVSVPTGIHT
jgi:hypothetical protein